MTNANTNDHAPPGAEAAPLDLSGRSIADFQILRKLGQGGMGQVYLAQQISLKRNVALKVLRPELSSSPKALARFEQEATTVAKVTHPNIVQVYAFGVEEGIAYVALEYVEGKNLKEILAKRGPPELPIALSIMRQVAAALQRASEAGIIHRDVKPENILVTRKTEVKVADFGLARVKEGDKPGLNLTQTGVTMGTPLYMSPEQVEGKPVDCRTDVYSFGVTCYHLLSGEPPFRGESAFEVALQHVQKQPVPLGKLRPDLPEVLCAIVHKMMAKSPDDRYPNGKEVARDLLRLREFASSASKTMQARPPSSGEQPTAKAPATDVGVKTVSMGPPLGPRAWLWGLGLFALLTVLAAGLAGAAYALFERAREGPLPHGQKIPPAEVDPNEVPDLPSKQEQRLREVVESYINPKGKPMDPAAGMGLCMDLGVLYLDARKNAEADAHFARLEKMPEPRYKIVGQTGKGIVLALEDKAKESNAKFREVFGVGGKAKGPPAKDKDKVDRFLAGKNKEWVTLAAGRQNVGWRVWLSRARWYNKKNGVEDWEVPVWLQVTTPLRDPDDVPK